MVQQQMTDADNFGATFPPGASPEDKVRAGGVVTAAVAGDEAITPPWPTVVCRGGGDDTSDR